jgi:type VI protein secretion system component VasA
MKNRDDFIRLEAQRLQRTLLALAERHPGVTLGAASGKILDPFLLAVVDTFAEIAGDARLTFAAGWPNLIRRALSVVAPHAEAILPPMSVFELIPKAGARPLSLGPQVCLRPATESKDPLARIAFCPPRWPAARLWAVSEVTFVSRQPHEPGLTLPSKTVSGLRVLVKSVAGAVLPRCRRLRLFCTGEDAVALALLQAVFADGLGVFVGDEHGSWEQATVRPASFGTTLLPTGRVLPSRRALQQMLAYPALHYFIDVLLPAAPAVKTGALTLFFAFRQPCPGLAALTSSTRHDRGTRLRLNCVPAINLLTRNVSIQLDGRMEYVLPTDKSDDFETYSVEEITEICRDKAGAVQKRSVRRRGAAPIGAGAGEAGFSWDLIRSGEGPLLMLFDEQSDRPRRQGERLEICLRCSSRDRATLLGPGTPMDVEGEGADGWSGAAVFKPTAALRLSDDLAAVCLEAHLAPPRLGMCSASDAAEVLRARLRAFALDGWTATTAVGTADSRPTDAARAIAGIEAVRLGKRAGQPVIRIRLDRACYPGNAPWLFGECLKRYLLANWPCGPRPAVSIHANGEKQR